MKHMSSKRSEIVYCNLFILLIYFMSFLGISKRKYSFLPYLSYL